MLNVRAGPGADFAIISTAKQGQSFDLVGRPPDNAWLRVCCFDNQPGWVNAALVDVTGGELAKLPVPKDMPTAAPSPTPGAAAPTPPPLPPVWRPERCPLLLEDGSGQESLGDVAIQPRHRRE